MVWWQPSLEFRRIKALLEREASIELKTVLRTRISNTLRTTARRCACFLPSVTICSRTT
jgi:hypothetical protein